MIKFTTEELEHLIAEINDKLLPAHELIKTRHKWSVYLSGTQNNITNATVTTIQFNTVNYDCEGGGIDSYGYTIPERGLYLVLLDVEWFNTIAAKKYEGRIYNGAVQHNYGARQSGYAGLLSAGGLVIMPAERGDVIYGKVYHDDGTNNPDVVGGGFVNTSMDIHLISRRCT